MKVEAERHCKEEEAKITAEQQKAWITRVSPLWKPLREQNLIAAGQNHTVGVKSDGTVITVGAYRWAKANATTMITVGTCQTPDWKDIVAVAAGSDLTTGLKANGTVVSVSNFYAQKGSIWTLVAEAMENARKEMSSWTNIVAIATGALHTVGLKTDGTIVHAGSNADGLNDVSGWKDIIAIAAGE